MRIVGVIAEYNPFHKGHGYHIEQIREKYDADFVIVVMSGDFVQRGEPAIVNKFCRAHMALSGGADLALELPVRFATGSAEYFATGAIDLLNSLGAVDAVCFGSESGDIKPLLEAARILNQKPEAYTTHLRELLKNGISYPAARAQALASFADDPSLSETIASPNNILGVEYCKALLKSNSSIEPLTIPRVDSAYHQEELSQKYSSATALRNCICQNDLNALEVQVLSSALHILKDTIKKEGISILDDYSLLLKYKLMCENETSLCQYLDMTPQLANRVLSNLDKLDTYTDFISLLKTKELTYTRISRALLHVLLNIKDFKLEADNAPNYGRILGFRRNTGDFMKYLKDRTTIPLITKLADASSLLDGTSLALLNQDIWVSNLYETVQAQKYRRSSVNEYRRQLIII